MLAIFTPKTRVKRNTSHCNKNELDKLVSMYIRNIEVPLIDNLIGLLTNQSIGNNNLRMASLTYCEQSDN